jgi:ABC-type nitrate/sulfonate/bicarbonate transport system substrate-binding protein
MTNETLEVIVFPGGFNWPIWAAQEIGAFNTQGIEVNLTPTKNSVQQMTGLIEGQYHIAMTAIDNVVAYQEGQGAAETAQEPDVFAFMGGDDGFLRLVVQSDIESYADLEGQELSVDAMTTGYAFVLLKMLEKGGLADSQYKLVSAGGGMERWEALKGGQHAGTLLMTPFDILAEFAGLRVLQSATDIFDQYQGVIGTARRGWAKDHSQALIAYIRAYLTGLNWLYDTNNKDQSLKVFIDNMPQTSPELAARIYDILLDPQGGFEPEARINLEGVKTVLNLRSEYGKPQKNLTDPAAYFDPAYYNQAVAT